MPANLTADYKAAEQKYREARTPKDKLEALQEMLRTIPKHKGTDHMQADIKKRISAMKKESGKKSVKSIHSLYVKPEGLGQVFLLGAPNAGKSTLLDVLTNARPTVADFPFTTVMYKPGMMRYVDVWVQLVDMPPISSQAMLPWIPSVVRYGDAALFVLSLASDDILTEAEDVLDILEKGKVRLARRGEETGMFDDGMSALKTLLVCTNCEAPDADYRLELLQDLLGDGAFDLELLDTRDDPESVDRLRERIYQMMGKVRVYTKQPGKQPDLKDPFVVRAGTTLEELAGKIHKDIRARLQYARIWSQDDRDLSGLRVARDYVVQERDIIEIHA